MSNPLLEMKGLPPFSKIKPEHIEPAIDALLEQNRNTLKELLSSNQEYSWANLVEPQDAMEDRLSRAWSPVSHMNSVVNSDELREAYNACIPKLSEYGTEMGQNVELYKAYKSIAVGDVVPTIDCSAGPDGPGYTIFGCHNSTRPRNSHKAAVAVGDTAPVVVC